MKKIIMVFAALVIVVAVVFYVFKNRSSEPALLQPTEKTSLSPEKIAEVFLKADYDGARLGGSHSLGEVASHMVSPEGEFEPGWDTAIIINDYSVSTPAIKNGAAKVVVRYNVLGSIAGAQELEKKNKTEKTEFHFKSVGSNWKLIAPVDLNPHISKVTAIKSLEDLIDPHDEERSEQMRQLISKVRKM
ncbi:hypothetical protein [Geomonas propionica]|uniref:Lipoprotein n=1 Tax=Geomonas propionica TaxID=2798582 RepID=A0ABS0YXH1_9BACT|nr:hypothetical protein [Geomonas propionica]MBJ6802676.1 hypothetical protein [Geomonas propionica]